jgi:hypothetical protein
MEISKEAMAAVELPPAVIPATVTPPIYFGSGLGELLFLFSICRAPSSVAKNLDGFYR